MADTGLTRRERIIKTLREEYGITNLEQLNEAIRTMKKLDITQFVYPVNADRECKFNGKGPVDGL